MIQSLTPNTVKTTCPRGTRVTRESSGPVDAFTPSEPASELSKRPPSPCRACGGCSNLKKQGWKMAMLASVAAIGVLSFTGCTPPNPNFQEARQSPPVVQTVTPPAAAPVQVEAKPMTEMQLRERELALKEREVQIREQELAVNRKASEKQNRVNDLRERELRQKQFERNADAAAGAVDLLDKGLSEFSRQVLR